ncbi:addiction module protein [Leucobacter sp. CSA2]|uniref:Addiction module protein n=1 Tax=Leucobacter edaphi TaxID=2796472 RepID=A0A934QAE5_9MICO|nr:addiction module protein [Leucobacter edaphi]MBK0421094.1 addiction module protein [Leucobacter edaphi]
MTPKLTEYIAEGRSLSVDERELAAVALLQISDDEQAQIDAAWRSELRRRIDDIESGKIELLDADEVHAQIRAKLAAMRE